MKKIIPLFLSIIIVACGGGSSPGDTPNPFPPDPNFTPTQTFTVPLSSQQNVPRVSPDDTPIATITIEIDDNANKIRSSFNASSMTESIDLSLNTGKVGTNGSQIFNYEKDGNDYKIPTKDITEDQIKSITDGQTYIQLSTASNKSYRGQVLESNYKTLMFDISGYQVRPQVKSDEKFSGYGTYNTDTKQLYLMVDTGKHPDVTAVQVVLGKVGVNGQKVFDLDQDANDVTKWTTPDATTLNDATSDALLSGDTYVNATSTAHPTGELRGQILSNGLYVATFKMSPKQAVPITDSSATATVYSLLNKNDSSIEITAITNGASSLDTITLRKGELGENGSNILELDQDQTDASVWTKKDTLSQDDIDALKYGGLYLAGTSTPHPEGEIRGQVLPEEYVKTFAFELAGSQTVNPTETDSIGRGYGAYNKANHQIQLRVNLEQFADSTSAHVHTAGIGENGNIAHDLERVTGSTTSWQLPKGSVLTEDQAKAVYDNELYVSIHSPSHANGKVRGQILTEKFEVISFTLSGNQNVPVVDTDAEAYGYALVDLENNNLKLAIETSATTDVTSVQLKLGELGKDGGDIITLIKDPNNPNRWIMAEGDTLTAAQFTEFQQGNLYVSVGTTSNPSGEVRGQVVNGNTVVIMAFSLTGKQQLPSNYSDKAGAGYLSLNKHTKELKIRVNAPTTDFTDASLNLGHVGINGSKILDLTKEPNLAINSSWYGDLTISQAQEDELNTAGLYVHANSGTYPAGEIRGQIISAKKFDFTHFTLSARQEIPAPTSNAMGDGYILLNKESYAIEMRVHVYDVNDATSAELADGKPGVVGTSVIALESTSAANNIWQLPASTTLTPDQKQKMMDADLYVSVKSTSFNNGELRGQIVNDKYSLFAFRISGKQQVPTVATDVKGSGYALINKKDLSFSASVQLTNSSGVSDVILQPSGVGEPNSSGGFFIQDPTNSNLWTYTSSIDDATIDTMENGLYSINVKSNSVPPGDFVRGQMLMPHQFFKTMEINGKQNIPSLTETATGQGYAMVDLKTKKLNLVARTTGLANPSTTSATINEGSAGRESSNELVTLSEIGGVFSTNSSLDKASIDKVINDQTYVQIDTQTTPNVEIRGQVLDSHKSIFSYDLTPAQLVPTATSSATGTGYVVIDNFDFTIDGVLRTANVPDPVNATASVHVGSVGVNGPESFALVKDPTDSNLWIPSDTQPPLTQVQIDNLNKGAGYTLVDAGTNAQGDLRGQIITDAFQVLTFPIEGSQVVSPNTAAPNVSGTGYGLVDKKDFKVDLRILLAGTGLASPNIVSTVELKAALRGNVDARPTPVKSLEQVTPTLDPSTDSEWKIADGDGAWDPSIGLTGGYYISANIEDGSGTSLGSVRGQVE